MRGLPRVTERTIVDAGALFSDLALTRERGYAFDDEETAIGLCCLGVAIRDDKGAPVASLSIAGPSGEFTGDQRARFVVLVREAGEAISRRLQNRSA